MSVSEEIMEKAENEAKAVLERARQKEDELYEKFKAEGHSGLDGHNEEYKYIVQEALSEIAKIREKYGIEVAPKK